MKPAYRPHLRYRSLLFGANISNVFVEGPGTIDGSGAFWCGLPCRRPALLRLTGVGV